MSRFEAVWPIVDPTVTDTGALGPAPTDPALAGLLADATRDLPLLAARAHARITGPVAYAVARSQDVHGSGNLTELCLIAHAPAVPAEARPYRTGRHAA